MSNRKSVPLLNTLPDDAAVEAELGAYAAAEAALQAEQTALDTQIVRLRQETEPRIAQLKATLALHRTRVQAWAEANRKERFDKKKSLNFLHATVGFLLGPEKIATLPRVTLPRALALLLTLPWGKRYLREKHEIDRETLLRDAGRKEKDPETGEETTPLPLTMLAEAGLQIVREEGFYIKTRRENLETSPS